MYRKLKHIWKKYKYEIVVGLSILVILIIALFRKNKRGTWSQHYIYEGNLHTRKLKKNIPKTSKGELECKRVLQKLFKRPFDKIRPDFLRNPVTGNRHNLEIDCYNEELKLGVEYSGIQHYKHTPFMHKNKEAFYNQKYRDELKKYMCKEHGITLIEVPYNIHIDDIEKFLYHKLISKGYRSYFR